MKSSCSDAASDPMQSLRIIIAPDSATYHMSPRKKVHDIKTGRITTMEQQKARSRQRNGLGIKLDADSQCRPQAARLPVLIGRMQ